MPEQRMIRSALSYSPLHALLLAALAVLIYSGTFHVPFVFDGIKNISENPIVHDLRYVLDPDKARGFLNYEPLRTRYIGVLSFALNYYFGGLDVTGFHVVNLIIHILNGFLVYWLVVLTFRTPMLKTSSLAEKAPLPALVAAVLFVAHPVQTQAVTYIVQRFASLVSLFYLGSMAAYIKARISPKPLSRAGFYLLSLCLAVAAMKTKENAFTLPIAVALYELFFFKAEPKRRFLYFAPLLLTMLIIPLTLRDLGVSLADVSSIVSDRASRAPVERWPYFLTEIRVVATYLRLIVLPFNQNLIYEYPIYTSLLQPQVLLAGLLHMALLGTALALFRRKRMEYRVVSYGIVFFYLALSVESGFIPLYPIFEHRVYLPSAGLFIAGAVLLMLVFSGLRSHMIQRAMVLFAIALLCLVSIDAFSRNMVWKRPLGLWSDVVHKAPQNSFARNNLGNAYLNRNMLDDALRQFKAAVEIEPSNSEALGNIGLILTRQGKFEESIGYFNEAIRYKPWNAYAYNNLGKALASLGRIDEAIQQLENALHFNQGIVAPHVNLGLLYMRTGRNEEAAKHFRMAIMIEPNSMQYRELLRQATGAPR